MRARGKQLNIRLSDEEADRIKRLTAHYGINSAKLIRMMLKEMDDHLANASRPK